LSYFKARVSLQEAIFSDLRNIIIDLVFTKSIEDTIDNKGSTNDCYMNDQKTVIESEIIFAVFIKEHDDDEMSN
jgi:hypothetical protein